MSDKLPNNLRLENISKEKTENISKVCGCRVYYPVSFPEKEFSTSGKNLRQNR